MKQTIYCTLTIVLSLFLTLSLTTQIKAQSRSLRGEKFVQAGIGFRGPGPLISLYGGMTINPTIKGAVGGGFGFGKVADLRYKYMFVDGIGSFGMKSVNRIFYLNALAGISFNGDLINDFETEKIDKRFKMNYGVIVGIEAEFHATRKLLFVLSGQQRYYVKKSNFGDWRYQVTAGIRITTF
jgi:hypothetical protein